MRDDRVTGRKALLVLAGFWAVGAVLLVVSRFGSAGVDGFRDAPACAPDQVFAGVYCRGTVEATVTSLSSARIVMAAGAREVSAEVNLHGTLPADLAGRPVRVTVYEGAVVHIAGAGLNVDTAATPVDRVGELRFAGLFFLVGGVLLAGGNALFRSRQARGQKAYGAGPGR